MFQAIGQVMANSQSPLPQTVLDKIDASIERMRQHARQSKVDVSEESLQKMRLKMIESEQYHRAENAKKSKIENQIKQIKKLTQPSPENFMRQHKFDFDDKLYLSEFAPCRGDLRAMPNDFARSSLFFVKKKGTPRKSMNREKIFHLSDKVEIRYTGEELRADDDELVWLSLVHYCYNKPLGDAVDIKVADLLKDLGWKPTGENYQRIRTIISRLKATDVIIKNRATYGDLEEFKQKRKQKAPSLTRGISMIDGYLEYDKVDGLPTRYLISIDKMLIFFFCGGLFTYLDWTQYKKLTPTGRRLTDYVLSHKNPEPLSVEKFLKCCGTDTTDLPAFRQNQQAKRACDELIKKGVVYDAKVEDGYIVIEREKPQILEHQP